MRLLGLVLVSVGLGLVGTPVATAAVGGQLCSPAGGVSGELKVTGWVNAEHTYDAAALAALPQTTVADTYLAGAGSTSSNYTGVDLARLLELPTTSGGIGTLLKPSSPTGPQGPTQRNDVTRYSVMVTGSDCFQAVFAMSEISPFFGGRPVVVATAQGVYDPGNTTTPVTGSLGASGFARISNPVDVRGSRRVSNIVEIRVLQAPAETATAPTQSPACAAGQSSGLTVDGFVTTPTTYDAAALAALPQSTVADTYLAGAGSTSANYTGVDLWRLLGLSATDGGIGSLIKPNVPGPQTPVQRNDLTRYSVMVTATDCFQALFSLAEISPFFGGRPVLVATAQGAYDPGDLTPVTGTLGSSGFARISNPVDVRGSRRVSNIAEIRVLATPTPTVSWPTPAAIAAGTPLGAAQLDATASYAGSQVPGTFVYDPPVGTVLAAGTHTVSALFVPSAPSSVSIARRTVSVTVLPAPVPVPAPPAAPTSLAGQVGDTITAGERTVVRTMLRSAGVPLAGQEVQLLVRKRGAASFVPRATVVTDSTGTVRQLVHPLRRTDFRWSYAGTATHAAVQSGRTTVRVRTAVTLAVSDDSVEPGGTAVALGRTLPARPGARATLWRQVDGVRTRLGSGLVGGDGRIRIPVALHEVGRYRVFLTVAAGAGNRAGTSPTRTVTVRAG